METLHAELRPKGASQPGEGAGLRLVFKGSGLRQHLASTGRKQQPGSWRQGGSEQRDGESPSPGEAAALTDSPGRPFSPSSAEASPAVPPGAPAAAGPRCLHGQPPGKAPYPDDRTPEAEAARAQPQPAAAADSAAAEAAAAGVAAAAQQGGPPAAAGPRSVHGQPPGKGVHPDDPAYRGLAPTGPDGPAAVQPPASPGGAQPGGSGEEGGGAGPRSVYGQPPGKNAAQIQQIAAASVHVEADDEDEPLSPMEAAGPLHAAPWHPQQAAAAAAGGPGQGHALGPAASSHDVRQRSAPPKAGGGDGGGSSAEQLPTRKRPASQLAGDGGQRKRAANGAAAGGDGPLGAPGGLQRLATAVSSSHAGVPASLARSASFHGPGPAGPVQQIRPMPGAPRSLQQRQQLANGAPAGAARQPAGAPRARQPPAPAKPKQPAKPAGPGQRRPSSAQGPAAAAAAAAAAAHQYKPGDIVWAKIGVYPWWPAQLQRPTAEEHFKPKHAATDHFCVFYGSNDYNWLPPNQIKPFSEAHPDYQRHAAVKNKALQRAIDEAWVYGLQRQRPDTNWTGARFVQPA